MDDFSDDGFDELNANALQELENNAIRFTQVQTKPDPTQAAYVGDFDDDDLDDAVVTDELRGQSVLAPETPYASHIDPPRQPEQQDAWARPPSHFRPQAIGSTARPPAQAHLALRPSQAAAAAYSHMRPPALPRPTQAISSRYGTSPEPQRLGVPDANLAGLAARIKELEKIVEVKDGEIGIVRNNMEKHRRDHDREVQALKKQTAEQVAKAERAVGVAKAAERTAATELEFTKRDLKEEVDRAKRKEKDGGTPKKNLATKTWGVSDGFDDIELIASPSRGNRGRSSAAVAVVMPEPPARLTRTPTKNKRKRPNIDSPIAALETTEDVVMLDQDDTLNVTAQKAGNVASHHSVSAKRTLSVDLLKVILNHSSDHDRPLTFDYLAGFAFPSKPTNSLASILFQKLATMGDPEDPAQLYIELCQQVIGLWLQCRKEGCLEPIAALVSLVVYILQLDTIGVAPYVAENLIATAMDSYYEVAIPRWQNNQGASGEPTTAKFLHMKKHIPTYDILSLMYLVALGCLASPAIRGALSSPIVDFWACVSPDFVLMLIRFHAHPIDDFIAMLKLLCTSVFYDSIGPISTTPNRTVDITGPVIVERLAYHLVEAHQWGVGCQKRWEVCFNLLRTLAAVATSPFGMRQLVTHDLVIPRIVTFLSRLIDELYDGNAFSPSTLLAASASQSSTTDGVPGKRTQESSELPRLIAHTMLLLHTIITNKENMDLVDVDGKLAKFTGGSQKYLLSLARLNFAEEGVSEETAELAHELLELAVTEEVGAELGEFFGG